MSETSTRMTIALVAWRALPAVLPSAGKQVGGLETGAWELARGLVHTAGQRAILVTESTRSMAHTNVDGVELQVVLNRWKDMREDFSQSIDVSQGFRLKRFSWRLLYQIPLLWLTRPWRIPDSPALASDPRLSALNCDVWGCFGVNADSARVVATALEQRRPCLLFLESNADLTADSREMAACSSEETSSAAITDQTDAANEYGVRDTERSFCLSRATAVVCQSNWQARRLAAEYGRVGPVIRNPIDLERWESQEEQPADYVLWIGRYDSFHKRPWLALEIARLCPDIPFRMIINRSSPSIERQVRERQPTNVTIVDYVPYAQMPQVFQQARIFLSTSSASHEGFPNVILQAVATRTPIVSLEDFDGFIESTGVGTCCQEDVHQAARQLALRWKDNRRTDRELAASSLRPFAREVVAQQVAQLARELHQTHSSLTHTRPE
jgi:hypothetical protein